ncbi:MAG: SDR family oxidoreductase, partial [Bacteroidales bacterium]|nr:SDR family oxidoreductase [Bacteroidales bacterium]
MILVSGGTGMLGAHLLSELVMLHEKVRAIKRTNSSLAQVKKIFSYRYQNFEKIFSQIEWVDADILDAESVNAAMEGVDKVYHCAAMVSFNPAKKYQMIDINVKGTANMVNSAIAVGVKMFCHVSSIAALGESENEMPVNEETFRKPNKKYSGYSISKYRSELEVWRGISEGLSAVIVNPSVILGVWDWKNGSSGIFKKVYQGLKFYTEGVTGYVDVLDVDQFRSVVQTDTNYNPALLGNSKTDWQKEIYTNGSGVIHNLTFSQGFNTFNYRISLNHTFQNGILRTDTYQRDALNLALTKRFLDSDLKLTLTSKGIVDKNRFANRGAIGAAIAMDPTQPIYDPTSPFDGYFEFRTGNEIGDQIVLAPRNPVALLMQDDNRAKNKRNISNFNVDYKFWFLKELKFNMN